MVEQVVEQLRVEVVCRVCKRRIVRDRTVQSSKEYGTLTTVGNEGKVERQPPTNLDDQSMVGTSRGTLMASKYSRPGCDVTLMDHVQGTLLEYSPIYCGLANMMFERGIIDFTHSPSNLLTSGCRLGKRAGQIRGCDWATALAP